MGAGRLSPFIYFLFLNTTNHTIPQHTSTIHNNLIAICPIFIRAYHVHSLRTYDLANRGVVTGCPPTIETASRYGRMGADETIS